jgi:hypothetical protein
MSPPLIDPAELEDVQGAENDDENQDGGNGFHGGWDPLAAVGR